MGDTSISLKIANAGSRVIIISDFDNTLVEPGHSPLAGDNLSMISQILIQGSQVIIQTGESNAAIKRNYCSPLIAALSAQGKTSSLINTHVVDNSGADAFGYMKSAREVAYWRPNYWQPQQRYVYTKALISCFFNKLQEMIQNGTLHADVQQADLENMRFAAQQKLERLFNKQEPQWEKWYGASAQASCELLTLIPEEFRADFGNIFVRDLGSDIVIELDHVNPALGITEEDTRDVTLSIRESLADEGLDKKLFVDSGPTYIKIATTRKIDGVKDAFLLSYMQTKLAWLPCGKDIVRILWLAGRRWTRFKAVINALYRILSSIGKPVVVVAMGDSRGDLPVISHDFGRGVIPVRVFLRRELGRKLLVAGELPGDTILTTQDQARGAAEILKFFVPYPNPYPRQHWLSLPVAMSDLNFDMFRDYDYRSIGKTFKPEVAFRLGLVWAEMALHKAHDAGITDNPKVLLARDARKIEPELVDALSSALRYSGLDVIYVSAKGPNAVTSYSWAMQEYKPLMSIFITASHVSEPKEKVIRGFKVTMLNKKGGSLQSMTTREIKVISKTAVIKLIEHPDKIQKMEGAQKGAFIPSNIDKNCVRFNTLIGEVVAREGSLYNLAREIQSSDSPLTVLEAWEKRFSPSQPLKGIKIVVEGAHTPSGKLTADIFSKLGAQAILINGDIWEIDGEHNADPSKEKNLAQLQKTIIAKKADFGIAFDLDGDRGAVVVPRRMRTEPAIKFFTLAPDNLIVVLLPYLIEKLGYNPKLIAKRIGVIRDVLGTFGVNDMAEKLTKDLEIDIKTFQTDAGYVFLKALRQKLLEEDYAIPIYGERSGHCWLDVSGEVENPVAVAILFATMVKKEKYIDDRATSSTPFFDTYREKSIPYFQSPRFQPAFHPVLLTKLSADPRNDTGWKYNSLAKNFMLRILIMAIRRLIYWKQKPTNPPQAIIALGKDTGVKDLQKEFIVGKTYNTPAGILKVKEFNTYQDPQEEGGLYRFADIVFELPDGRFAGRFVFRASSNDPTFVCSYETPLLKGEDWSSQSLEERKISVGGVVLDWLEQNGYALLTKENMQEKLGLSSAEADKKSKDLNLAAVEEDLVQYRKRLSFDNNGGSLEKQTETGKCASLGKAKGLTLRRLSKGQRPMY